MFALICSNAIALNVERVWLALGNACCEASNVAFQNCAPLSPSTILAKALICAFVVTKYYQQS